MRPSLSGFASEAVTLALLDLLELSEPFSLPDLQPQTTIASSNTAVTIPLSLSDIVSRSPSCVYEADQSLTLTQRARRNSQRIPKTLLLSDLCDGTLRPLRLRFLFRCDLTYADARML